MVECSIFFLLIESQFCLVFGAMLSRLVQCFLDVHLGFHTWIDLG